jgi:hypothetical protein
LAQQGPGDQIGRTDAIERWDGTSRSVLPSPALSSVGLIYDISASAANNLWAVGGVARLHFDGTSWSQVGDSNRVNAGTVLPLSPANVWASGVGPSATRNSFPFATFEQWDRIHWSIVSSLNPDPHGNSGAVDMAAVCVNGIFDLAFARIEHCDGTNWSIIDATVGFGPTGVTALGDGTVVVLGENGGIQKN